MNKEEIGIWLKHFADKSVGYQIYEDGKWKREINLFLVFRELMELKCKVNQLETNIYTAIDYINKLEFEEYGVLYDNGTSFMEYEDNCKETLLEILKGGSDE